MRWLLFIILTLSVHSYGCFDDNMNYYPCDKSNNPLNYTPIVLNPISLLQSQIIQHYKYMHNSLEKNTGSSYDPYQDYVPTGPLNNEEYLYENEMAEYIVIGEDMPTSYSPEFDGLENADIIEDPYIEEDPYY